MTIFEIVDKLDRLEKVTIPREYWNRFTLELDRISKRYVLVVSIGNEFVEIENGDTPIKKG